MFALFFASWREWEMEATQCTRSWRIQYHHAFGQQKVFATCFMRICGVRISGHVFTAVGVCWWLSLSDLGSWKGGNLSWTAVRKLQWFPYVSSINYTSSRQLLVAAWVWVRMWPITTHVSGRWPNDIKWPNVMAPNICSLSYFRELYFLIHLAVS